MPDPAALCLFGSAQKVTTDDVDNVTRPIVMCGNVQTVVSTVDVGSTYAIAGGSPVIAVLDLPASGQLASPPPAGLRQASRAGRDGRRSYRIKRPHGRQIESHAPSIHEGGLSIGAGHPGRLWCVGGGNCVS